MTFIDTFFFLIVLFKIFELHRFLQIKHREIDELNEKTKQIVIVIVASSRTSSHFSSSFRNTIVKSVFSNSIDFSIEWSTNINLFRKAIQKFREHTIVYRLFSIFQNFLNSRSISLISSNSSNDIRSITRISWISRFRDDLISSFFQSSVKTRRVSIFSFSFIINQDRRSRSLFIFEIIRSNNSIETFDRNDSNFAKTFESNLVNIKVTSVTEKIFRNMNKSFIDSHSFVIDFIDVQRRELVHIMIETFAQRQENQNDDENDSISDFSTDFESTSMNDNNNNNNDWKAKNVDFFKSNAEENKSDDVSIVTVEKHVCYVDVYVFINRLKNLIFLRDDDKLRTILSQCLQNVVLIWHIMKFFEFEKNLFRIVSFASWYDALIVKFKKRVHVVLKRLHRERYIFVDAKNRKDFRLFAQNIFRHVKAIEMIFIFNQIIMIWNNFDWKFRRDISKFTSETTIWKFLFDLDSKTNIWYEMIKKKFFTHSKINQRFSKQNSRQNDRVVEDYNDEYYQSIYQSNRFSNYFFKSNQIYQNNRQNISSNERQSIHVLSFAKQSLLLIDENASDSRKDQKFSINAERSDNVFRDRNFRTKNRVYVVNEKKKKKNTLREKNISEIDDDVYYIENLKYYNSNNQNFHSEDDEKFIAHFVVFSLISYVYRRCDQQFFFNNRLHAHLRTDCFHMTKFVETKKLFASNDSESNFKFIVYFTKVFFIDVTKTSSFNNFKSIVIRFNVNVFKNVDSDYDFRDWNYFRVKIFLIENDEQEDVTMNIDADITLTNENFIRRQKFDVVVRKMIFSIIVRDLDTTQHESSNYVILSMYLLGTKNDASTKTLIEKKIHFVRNLKINMLIDNDIIVFESIVTDVDKQKITIRNCDITILMKIRFRVTHVQQRSIHAKKIIILSSRAQLIIVVHNLFDELFVNRDFFFEFDDIEFILYAHFVDFFIKIILITNNTNVSIKISRNFRLKKFVELNYFNVFHVDEQNVIELTVRMSTREHKFSWFKKVLSIFVVVVAVTVDVVFDFNFTFNSAISFAFDFQITTISSSIVDLDFTVDVKKSFATILFTFSNVILSNEITIHQFVDIEIFVSIMKKFSILWIDADFVELFEENWMRIFLKSNWKNRVFDKTKIYSLDARDRELVNKIFDEFHEQKRMLWTDISTSFSYSIFCVWKKNVNDESKNKMIINIRDLNAIIVSNVYSLFLQFDIIFSVRNCSYIFVIDASAFFYQWRVHSNDRHKLIVITHRD